MFPRAYGPLFDEFDASDEVEQPEVLARRMQWNPTRLLNGCGLLYELLLVTKDGGFVGVRDHTAIVRPEFQMAVVHMSHNLVAPPYRRSGIAGWLRALPIAAARKCLAAQGLDQSLPIYLVGEMEPADPANEARTVRLTAYEKAGYRKIDPSALNYLQPDFRPPAEIDASGGPQPLPLSLLVRKVGRESETAIRAETVHRIATCLYRMYEMEFRPRDMECVWKNLEHFPRGEQLIPLLPPTAL
jgi:GNAT superfamily N-acetyltransferase